MEEKRKGAQGIARKLKWKRARKYAIFAVVAVLIVSAVSGFSLEGGDAKLTDGQGQVIDYTAGEQQQDGQQGADSSTKSDANEDKADASAQGNGSGQDGDKTPGKKKDQSAKPDEAGSGKQTADKNHDGVPDETQTPQEAAVDNSKDPTASNGGNVNTKPETPEPVEVTIAIYCKALSDHMEKLENPAIKDYIPADGVICKKTTYKGTTDNTVFDALNTVCRNSDIQLDFSYTPLYESYYIKGINYLYEFDGGNLSGWMYKVNGWFPNYGCSSYYLKDGDEIVWVYTCDLGDDVGGSVGG